MDISGGLNRPVNIYGASTGNNISIASETENKLYGANILSSEFIIKEAEKVTTKPQKRRKKTGRLNTIDTNFLPDEISENEEHETELNFFVENTKTKIITKIKTFIEYLLKSLPIINCVYLKRKSEKIQQTVEELTDIMQNADELINASVPYGESGKIYKNIAQNLTDAAIVIGKANKEF